MTEVREFVDRDPVMAELVDRIRDLEREQATDREIIADQQDKIIEREMANEHLNAALVSSRRIGAAMGILMNSLKISEDDAFGLLTTNSQLHNRKLRLVAEDIILSGAF